MNLIKAILTLVSNLLGIFEKQQLIDAGIAKAENETKGKVLKNAKIAKNNRDNVDNIDDNILL